MIALYPVTLTACSFLSSQASLLRDELQRVAAERDTFLQEKRDVEATLAARIEAATAGGERQWTRRIASLRWCHHACLFPAGRKAHAALDR